MVPGGGLRICDSDETFKCCCISFFQDRPGSQRRELLVPPPRRWRWLARNSNYLVGYDLGPIQRFPDDYMPPTGVYGDSNRVAHCHRLLGNAPPTNRGILCTGSPGEGNRIGQERTVGTWSSCRMDCAINHCRSSGGDRPSRDALNADSPTGADGRARISQDLDERRDFGPSEAFLE